MISQDAGALAAAGRGGGAGRGRTQQATIPADRLKDSESKASARYGPRAATTTPPASRPATWPSWAVWLPRAVPAASMRRGSTLGSRADRAAENGTPSITVPQNSSPSAGSGSPASAISATSPARARSSVIMSCCRGKRSASPDSSGPPTTGGR